MNREPVSLDVENDPNDPDAIRATMMFEEHRAASKRSMSLDAWYNQTKAARAGALALDWAEGALAGIAQRKAE